MNKENGTYNKHLQKYSRIVQDDNDDLVYNSRLKYWVWSHCIGDIGMIMIN